MSIMLDTGSTVGVISEKMWRKTGTTGVDLRPICSSLTTANGQQLQLLERQTCALGMGTVMSILQ